MKTKDDCIGCEDNFYNGNNPYEIQECWHFKDAKFVFKKAVPLDQVPPHKQKLERFLNCYKKKGYVFYIK